MTESPVSAGDSAEARPRSRVGAAVGAVLGAVLGAVFGAAAKVRDTKPLHPVGQVGDGILEVTRPLPELGVPLLEKEGSHPCLVRWSRAMGLPSPLPDVEGLAIRFEEPTADLLFAATGTGTLTRFLLVPRTPGNHGSQSTLLPVSTRAGSLVLRVTPAPDGNEPPNRFGLAVAHSGGEWRTVGRLEVPQWGPDRPIRFDPVTNVLTGTRQYPLVRMLREPAYLMARRGASADD